MEVILLFLAFAFLLAGLWFDEKRNDDDRD